LRVHHDVIFLFLHPLLLPHPPPSPLAILTPTGAD